jgi:2-methylisocitrate lyase-like PEP mutase family enzyme
MPTELREKARRFADLHQRADAFVMPNAWDAGSARLLADAGFPALATTSAGIAFARGLPDYEDRVPRPVMLEACGAIAAAVDLPVSGDLEAGYGATPDEVAETMRLAVECGLAGGSLEDHWTDGENELYDVEAAAERVAAARAAIDASGLAFVLTARAECYLVGHPDPFAESVRRLNRYREAGADCLYAPGQRAAEEIGRLVREVDGPVNVVMGLAGAALTVAELAALGVKRISIGGSLARTSYAVVKRAASEIAGAGTFSYAADAIPDSEMNAFMAGRPDRNRH